MNAIATTRTASAQPSTEHFDVLIAGAAISGDHLDDPAYVSD
jgi:hypothetical protein